MNEWESEQMKDIEFVKACLATVEKDNVRLVKMNQELLEALKGLYEHTKNNRQIMGLNTVAKEAIERAEK